MKFTSSLKPKLIYVFRINDTAHLGCLKVGEATVDTDDLFGLQPTLKVSGKGVMIHGPAKRKTERS